MFWDLVERLAGEGTTILLTTHYLEEAERLADRVAVIARGVILDVATPATIGGRDAAHATVAWTGRDGRRHTVRTATPTATVAGLSAEFDGEVPDLSVQRPTLEDTYLAMVGEL